MVFRIGGQLGWILGALGLWELVGNLCTVILGPIYKILEDFEIPGILGLWELDGKICYLGVSGFFLGSYCHRII